MFWCSHTIGNFFSNKFNSRLNSQTFLKFRTEHHWDRSLFSWDWLRKADVSDHSASIDISASAPIDISIKCRDTPSHFSKGLLSRSIPPSINHFSLGKDFDIFFAPRVWRDATSGGFFAFLHYCALPNKGWPHEEDPLQVICALFAHSANFQHL